jgi:hypothetical protein
MSDRELTKRKKRAAKKRKSRAALSLAEAKKRVAKKKLEGQSPNAKKKARKKRKVKKVESSSATSAESLTQSNLQDVQLAADLAAEKFPQVYDGQDFLPKPVKSPYDDPWRIRSHMKKLAALPINLRLREYKNAIEGFDISDNLYYRIYADIALSRDELISMMMLLSGKYKEDTQAAIKMFLTRFPSIRANTVYRSVRLENGEAKLHITGAQDSSEDQEKQMKKIKGQIRRAITAGYSL